MKKKLRLKKEVKERLIALAVSLGFILLFVGGMVLYSYRIEQINNGELVVINDNQMDR